MDQRDGKIPKVEGREISFVEHAPDIQEGQGEASPEIGQGGAALEKIRETAEAIKGDTAYRDTPLNGLNPEIAPSAPLTVEEQKAELQRLIEPLVHGNEGIPTDTADEASRITDTLNN